MMDICTKFEVSMYTRYEEMKGGAKCKNGVWGRSWVGNVTIC